MGSTDFSIKTCKFWVGVKFAIICKLGFESGSSKKASPAPAAQKRWLLGGSVAGSKTLLPNANVLYITACCRLFQLEKINWTDNKSCIHDEHSRLFRCHSFL